MFARSLDTYCDTYQLFFRQAGHRDHICDGRPALCDRTCFIQDYGIDAVGDFQRFAGFYKDSVFCAFTGSYHDRYRGSQSQSAWTRDDEDRDADRQSEFKSRARDNPDEECSGGDPHDNRDENTGDFVGHFCDRRF